MAARSDGVDTAVRIVVPSEWAETVGALLMEPLGAYEQQDRGSDVILVFYPPSQHQKPGEILAFLPPEMRASPLVTIETVAVARDWEEGWKDHFHPIVIGRVRIRPPWEPPLAEEEAAGLVEVVINPGMGFGTGLHPTTRGPLELLQRVAPDGAVVDAGTGSGVLTVAAAKLGWGPIFAFDNDPVAIDAATENLQRNRVAADLQLEDVASVPLARFSDVTVLANMTLEPLIILLERLRVERHGTHDSQRASAGKRPPAASQGALATGRPATAGEGESDRKAGTKLLPHRMIVSGVLAGEQEEVLVQFAQRCGLIPGARVYETEWVSMELIPGTSPSSVAPAASDRAAEGCGRAGSAATRRGARQALED